MQLILQVLQEIQHLRANGHVQGGYGFVRDDQTRIERQRAGNADALALAAAEGVRIAPHIFGAQADHGQQLRDAGLQGGAAQAPVDLEAFADDVQHRQPRIQGREGVLEDEADFLAVGSERLGRETRQIHGGARPRPVQDFAARRFEDAQQAAARSGFAASGFADQAQRLAGPNVETDVVHGADGAAVALQETRLDGKVHAQVLHLQQGRAGCVAHAASPS